MKRSREFDNNLDECLERLLAKGETLEQCLESYPEQADELKPLLQTALVAQKTSAVQPRPEFKARARYEFRSALQEIAPRKSRPLFGWKPQWATVIITVLVLILAGGGTVAAAGNSMPDEPLYPVKLATEQARLTLTPSDIGKAQLAAELADKRINEIIYLADKGKAQQIAVATRRLDTLLARVAILATVQTAADQNEESGVMLAPPTEEASEEIPVTPAPTPAPAPRTPNKHGNGNGAGNQESSGQNNQHTNLRNVVARHRANNLDALHAALETAPASAQQALRQAIAVSAAGYEEVLTTLD